MSPFISRHSTGKGGKLARYLGAENNATRYQPQFIFYFIFFLFIIIFFLIKFFFFLNFKIHKIYLDLRSVSVT